MFLNLYIAQEPGLNYAEINDCVSRRMGRLINGWTGGGIRENEVHDRAKKMRTGRWLN